jgi:MoaA/NifB/PqqE/SkfB family radical SAM enzyme
MINIKNLYRMPWSKNDNPNGWVEITRACNFRCPNCYRGADRKDHKHTHKPLKEIKKEIIELKKIRNCETISLSGGEPLLHPDILKIIRFIKKRSLYSFLFTNGSLLDEKMIKRLKSAGITGIIVHIDSLQYNKTEKELNSLRNHYMDLINKYNIYCGFIATLSKKNINEAVDVIKWAQKNSEKIEQLVFTLTGFVNFDNKKVPDSMKMERFYEIVRKLKIEPSCYLGKTRSKGISWLFAGYLSIGNKFFGYSSPKLTEFTTIIRHWLTGKYWFVRPKKDYIFPKTFLLFLGLFTGKFWKTLKFIITNPKLLFKKAHLMTMLTIQFPGFYKGKRDLCDGCPDATLYKGRLVPSCLLEEVIKYGDVE